MVEVRSDKAQARPDIGTYDTALICEVGHLVTIDLRSSPETGRKFCERCGAPTLSSCRVCGRPIPGRYWVPGALPAKGGYRCPGYCGDCGEAYPWTTKAIEELRNIVAFAEGLEDAERVQLSTAIDNLITDTPATESAIRKVNLLAPKVGREAWEAMKAVLVGVGTEAAKRGLGL